MDAMREAQWDRMIDKMAEDSCRAYEQRCEGRADALLAEVRPRLAQCDSLVPLLVPTKHGRRAELAVVLAELDEWQVGRLGEPLAGSRRPWPEMLIQCGEWCFEGSAAATYWTNEEIPLSVTDPLEAARLALAHVRGQE